MSLSTEATVYEYDNLPVLTLKSMLKERGMSAHGTKAGEA